ncbi:MAG: pirin family protein [Myxococcales bacterium]|nr:pirin family protein [Myxococcales bacterium]
MAKILEQFPLGTPPWKTFDPFLFCVHHNDAYPAGNAQYGPAAPLTGRRIGQDFEGIDGWRMYHGDVVPGFPAHPHRGFETITVTSQGYIDHADSMGAAARYGNGDVQWMTAGNGVMHAEMFPLLRKDGENPMDFFQIWLNLPREDKRVPPYFSMFWSHQVPKLVVHDDQGRASEIRVVAGALGDATPPAPPPNSWAARREADIGLWTARLLPGAQWTLPAANPGTQRTIYFFEGASLRLDDHPVTVGQGVRVQADTPLTLTNGLADARVLVLQGRPIGEPVVKHGPFVMNTVGEIREAYADYQRTRFGGWPWPGSDPVHGGKFERFARHADGREERPA